MKAIVYFLNRWKGHFFLIIIFNFILFISNLRNFFKIVDNIFKTKGTVRIWKMFYILRSCKRWRYAEKREPFYLYLLEKYRVFCSCINYQRVKNLSPLWIQSCSPNFNPNLQISTWIDFSIYPRTRTHTIIYQ